MHGKQLTANPLLVGKPSPSPPPLPLLTPPLDPHFLRNPSTLLNERQQPLSVTGRGGGGPDRKHSTRIRQQQAKGVTRCAELLARSTHVPGLATLTRVLIKLKGLVFVRGIQAPAVLSTRGTWRSTCCVLRSVASPSHLHPFTPTSFNWPLPISMS